MKIIHISTSILIIFTHLNTYSSSKFEELDKPPEGAHAGQMLLSGFVSIGFPFGDIITGEEKFTKNNTYTFQENGTTKEMLLTHLSYDFGVSFEYMPLDYIGIKSKLKRSIIVQRTRFGSDYQNWNKELYDNLSLLLGPSFHLTNRKQWDVCFTPMIGYALAEYHATPIAAELITSYQGDRVRKVNNLTYSTEIDLIIYFSGGFYLSFGTDLNIYPLNFKPSYTLTESGQTFMNGKSSGTIYTLNIIFSAGYAFSN